MFLWVANDYKFYILSLSIFFSGNLIKYCSKFKTCLKIIYVVLPLDDASIYCYSRFANTDQVVFISYFQEVFLPLGTVLTNKYVTYLTY